MNKAPWTHFGYTKESMAALAIHEFRKMRAKTKPTDMFSDGSSGQYDQFTESMVAALSAGLSDERIRTLVAEIDRFHGMELKDRTPESIEEEVALIAALTS